MTISQAFGLLIETIPFKEICKEKKGKGAKYRVYKGRYLRNELHELAMLPFLLDHGYTVTVSLPKKKK